MWLVLALSSAVFFGLRGILYQWTSQKPMDRNLMLFGVYFTGLLASLLFSTIFSQQWSIGVLAGLAMGFFSFIANGAMYRGYAVGKASIVAIFTGLPPVVVILLAYALWKETLTVQQILSFLLIVIGILFMRYSGDLSIGQLKGLFWAALAMIGFGFTDISSKQAMLWQAEIFPTLSVTFATGSVLFCLSWLNSAARNRTSSKYSEGYLGKEERKWKSSTTFFWGMLVGITNIFGMFFILSAFTSGLTALVSAVASTNILIILLYARFVLKDRFQTFEWIGIICTILGITSLHLF